MKINQRLILTVVLISAMLTAVLAVASPVKAASVEVTNPKDEIANNDGCSLREAVIAVNTGTMFNECDARGGLKVIMLQPGMTYTLSIPPAEPDDTPETGDLDLLTGMEIIGDHDTPAVIDAAGNDRVLHIKTTSLVNIYGVVIQGGGRVSAAESRGGGIYLESGKLYLNYVTVSGNGAYEEDIVHAGGGIFALTGTSLSIYNTIISGNQANFGGGIFSYSTILINSSSLIENEAKKDNSGGALDFNGSGDQYARLINTTVSGNKGTGAGGIFSAGSLILENSTIVDNQGTGIALAPGARESIIKNSIIARQHNGAANCLLADSASSVLRGRRNMADDSIGNSCNLDKNSGDQLVETGQDKINAAPPDRYDGSFTLMYGIDPTSDAVRAGQNCTGMDQRGKMRSSNCTLGSFEVDGVDPILTMLPLIAR